MGPGPIIWGPVGPVSLCKVVIAAEPEVIVYKADHVRFPRTFER